MIPLYAGRHTMPRRKLPDNFYERIKPGLHERVGRELRLAGTVLDLGCGSCELVQYLAETYRQKVIGVDLASDNFPKKRHTHAGVRFRCIGRDATHIDFAADDSVDAIVSMWALHEMHHPKAILREAHRILRPGGKILVVDFPRDSLAQTLWHEDYHRPEDIAQMLREAGFREVRDRLTAYRQIAWVHGWKRAT